MRLDASTAGQFTRALATVSEAFAASEITNKMIKEALELMETSTPEAAMFKHYAGHFGLKTDDFGKVFVFRGAKYRICGLNPRAPKYPVNTTRIGDSKPFRFPESLVRECLLTAGAGKAA